jgi:hypothetical protein
VARRKKSVVLAKLAEDSRGELNAMVAELSGGNADSKGLEAKPAHKRRRFAASGKFNMR